MTRNNIVACVVGGRGTGKTTWVLENLIVDKPGIKKTLVLDTFNHPKYRHLPPLTLNILYRWKIDAKGTRFLPTPNTKEAMRQIKILPNLWNSSIVFEDATKYIEPNIDNDVKQFILDTKQRNIDLYFLFHGLARVPRFLCENSDILIMLKTNDTPQRAKRFAESHKIEKVLEQQRTIDPWFYPKHKPAIIKLT